MSVNFSDDGREINLGQKTYQHDLTKTIQNASCEIALIFMTATPAATA